MCGIAGWIDFNNNLTSKRDIIEEMSKTLKHRGPDAHGTYICLHALIAHRRLSVIDPAGGKQPMVRKHGDFEYVVTYNGELYNTSELRTQLENKGHFFTTNSDTEVLLISYIEWGIDCVSRLNGIFAFGIWDGRKQQMFLARDRFGVKPLFYSIIDGSLIFGSELKALLAHPFIKPQIDVEGLNEIFSLGPARTPGHGVYRNMHEIKPAHCMVYAKENTRRWQYWKLESHPHTDSFEETVSVLKMLVSDAIKRQLVSDVPLCTFLSGGLDSSAISAISSDSFKSSGKGRLNTFSVDYTDNDKYFKSSSYQPDPDEPWIKRMSDELGTCHHYINFDTPQLVKALYGSLTARDLPGMADIDSSLWLFCKEIKKGFTVGLSGECADEVFGGYPWFHRQNLLNEDTFPWSVNIGERLQILSNGLTELLNPREYIRRRYLETLEEVPYLSSENALEKRRREMFYLNITWFMTTLLDRKDRMSMAHGLEVRVPYCDHHLVQYVWNIPWSVKMHKGREKGVLREALKDTLPDDILLRKKSPYPKTHNPSYETTVKKLMTEILNDAGSPLLPLINRTAVEKLLQISSDYGKPWFGQLMATPQMLAYLIQVDAWLREYNIEIV
jgi:asparagine synthase (glutamine-hydrolysing)